MSKPDPRLSTLNVLVTRPEKKGRALTQALNQHHITAQHCSLFSYQMAGTNQARETAQLLQHNNNAILIFVSVAAVEFAVQIVPVKNWQYHLVFAVGKATQQALMALGIHAVSPIQEDSEGVLALPQLSQVDNQFVVIVRGDEGRELIFQTLVKRGAKVHYGQSYQRIWQLPSSKETDLWLQQGVNCLVITSVALLENMVDLLVTADNYWQKSCLWLVASARIAERAKQLNLHQVINTHSANNQCLLQFIMKLEDKYD